MGDIDDNSQNVSIYEDGTDKTAKISGESELLVKPPSQNMFDAHFNEVIDPAVWESDTIGGGTLTVVNSFLEIVVGTASGDSASMHSVQPFRHIFSQTLSFRCGIIIDQEFLNNNQRSWGMHNHDTNDGWFFRLDNGVLKACTEHSGAITDVSIDSFKPTDGKIHRYDAVYRNYKVIFIIDNVVVHTAFADVSPLYNNENLKLHFANENTGVTTASAKLNVEGCSLFDDSSSSVKILGQDDAGNIREVSITAEGRLLVSQEPAPSPPGTTDISDIQFDSVTGTDDSFTVIPTSEQISIIRFKGGSTWDNTGGSIISVWEAPNGDTSGIVLIEAIIVNGNTSEFDVSFTSQVGDGTAAILLRRDRGGGGAATIFGKWEGFY